MLMVNHPLSNYRVQKVGDGSATVIIRVIKSEDSDRGQTDSGSPETMKENKYRPVG